MKTYRTQLLFQLLNRYYQFIFPKEYALEQLCRHSLHQNLLKSVRRSSQKELFNALSNLSVEQWNDLIQLISINKLHGLIDQSLHPSMYQKLVPPSILAKLKISQLTHKTYATLFRLQSLKALKTLNSSHIKYIILKSNITWVSSTYCSVKSDVDIFVSVSEFARTYNVLIHSGYRYIPDSRYINNPGEISYLSTYIPKSQESFANGNHVIEVHTLIVDCFHFIVHTLNEDQLQELSYLLTQDTRIQKINNILLSFQTPTSMVLSMLLHTIYQHNYERGAAFFETAELLIRYKNEIDWPWVLGICRQYKLLRLVEWYLLLLYVLYPLSVSELTRNQFTELKHLSFSKTILFFYMRRNIFHPTGYLHDSSKEQRKEYTWAVIQEQFFSLLIKKMIRFPFNVINKLF